MLKRKSFLESFIIIVILASIIEIFIEEISVIGNWKVPLRSKLLIIGFLFDLIFTIEFIIRSILSKKAKGWVNYWKNEKGWIDFLCSVPLILFSSGPIMLGMFYEGGIITLPFLGLLNILKITKLLRVARVLRLLRVLKIFNKVITKETEQKIKEVSLITSITVLTITIILIIVPLFPGLFYSQDANIDKQNQKYVSIINEWHNSASDAEAEKLEYLLKRDKNTLYIYYIGDTIVNNLGAKDALPNKIIPAKFLYTDFEVLKYRNFTVWYSVKETLADNSKINLLIELIIIVLLIAYISFYKPNLK